MAVLSDMETCKVDTCARPKGRRRGWCATHYEEWKKTGQEPVKIIRLMSRSSISDEVAETRTCVQCKVPKKFSLEDFRPVPTRRDKLDSMCKKCRQLNHRLARMSLTKESFQARLESQKYCCAGCHCPLPESWSKIYVDHDHECCPGIRSCGKCIRGLLHNACNVIMGHSHDNPELLRQLADYLEKS